MLLIFGAIIGALSVAIGAFGAHVLEPRLAQDDFATFQTAVRYQMYHSLLLMIVGLWYRNSPDQRLFNIGLVILGGILLFSGSLYLIVFTGIQSFGAVAPLGGMLLIIGWASLAWIAYSTK
ncbi:MAG: DUF423 domain-containing protein [Methanobacteriota archaeon]|nr:MAG: DUF423 domain-containing protein [Euryarchaeota archaeon]